MSIKLSIFIICKNEERIIEQCLSPASKLADELIIVDSGSTDNTLNIAHKYTNKVFHQDWLGYGAQKNIALAKCSNEWVLSLDADEVLTDELIAEIRNLDFKADAYKIARKLFIGDKFIRWSGYYPDYQLRLFKKALGAFSEVSVHESVQMPLGSNIEKLKNPLDHYSYQNLEQMQSAFDKYAKLAKASSLRAAESGVAIQSNYSLKPYIKYIYTFVNKFFLRLGFLHGILGLKLALMHARYSFRKYG